MSDYIAAIADLHACSEAMEWLRAEGHPDLATAWANCPRGDWMLWLAGRVAGPPGHPSRIPLVLAACDCAELALKHVSAGEDRPRNAIVTARAWTRGEATLEEVRDAARAAYDDAAAAYYAAGAAYYAADSAYYAADSAAAADAAADAADAADAYDATLSECAEIVRRHYPNPPEVPDAR